MELFREIDSFIGSENFLADISQQQKKIELRSITHLNRHGLLQRSLGFVSQKEWSSPLLRLIENIFFFSEVEILFKNSIFLWKFQNETQYEHSWSLELRLKTYYWASDRFMFIKNFWRPLRNLVVKIRRNTLFRSSRMGTQKSKVDFIVFHRFQPFDLWNQNKVHNLHYPKNNKI